MPVSVVQPSDQDGYPLWVSTAILALLSGLYDPAASFFADWDGVCFQPDRGNWCPDTALRF